MARSLQRLLNDKAYACGWDDGSLEPCGYHRDRSRCALWGIEEAVVRPQGRRTALLEPGGATRELAKRFQGARPPAGGWYLVKEQREWLTTRLEAHFDRLSTERPGPFRPIRLLIAGVASFVHFYGTLALVRDALLRREGARATLIVVDRCAAPLVQIAAVEDALGSGLGRPRTLEVAGRPLTVDRDFLRTVDRGSRAFSRISVELWLGDLRDSGSVAGLGAVDLVLEHFLTSLLDKRFEEIEPVRDTYRERLADGGAVLTAVGLSAGSDRFADYVRLFAGGGFRHVEASDRAVWDPYGLTTEALDRLRGRGAAPLPVALDNTLCEFLLEEDPA